MQKDNYPIKYGISLAIYPIVLQKYHSVLLFHTIKTLIISIIYPISVYFLQHRVSNLTYTVNTITLKNVMITTT